MAKDDMMAIAYQILKYLHDAMRKGKDVSFEDIYWDGKLFKIPEKYWVQVMVELIDQGYIKGFEKIPSLDGNINIKIDKNASITLKGSEYLTENSGMKKVKEFLGETFEILLRQIIR